MIISIDLDVLGLVTIGIGSLGVVLAALEYLGITKLAKGTNPLMLSLISCGLILIPITQALKESIPGNFSALVMILPLLMWILAIRVQMHARWQNTHIKSLNSDTGDAGAG